MRRKSSAGAGVQDALGGLWKLRWWRGKQDNDSDVAVANSPGAESGRRLWSPSRRQQHYEDEPEDEGERRPRPGSPRGDDAV